MLSDILPPTEPGRIIDKELDANTSVNEVLLFIQTHLEIFAGTHTDSGIKNEFGLNQELCLLLNLYARKEQRLFFFDKEYMENPKDGNSAKVDFGVIPWNSIYYNIPKAFLAVEAKRLDHIDAHRQREYLIGREENGKYKPCGGVERFKIGIHGQTLQYGAMIGYVQVHDFQYWHKKINTWIGELLQGENPTPTRWSEQDKLIQLNKTENTAKFRSQNSRLKMDSIVLFHLWVNLVDTQK